MMRHGKKRAAVWLGGLGHHTVSMCAMCAPGDRNRIRWSAVVRTHLGHLSDPAEIVGFGCTRIAAGRQAEIFLGFT
jgi:hypothetical protein